MSINVKSGARPKAEPKAEGKGGAGVGVQTIVVGAEDDGMRLDRWFRHRFPALSLSHLNRIVRKGEVRVDGKRAEGSTRLVEGNAVRVPPLKLDAPSGGSAGGIASPAVKKSTPASPADVRMLRELVLFEDKHLMVINKPFGLAVQGGSGTTRHIDGMLMAMEDEKGERPVLVHRLDRDTSGVLLIAKTRKIASDLGELFRSRQARKIYWAVVEGVPKPLQGRISLFLAKGAAMGDNRSVRSDAPRGAGPRVDPEKMRVVKHGAEDAQHSVTFYATVDKVQPRLAWLSMKPITGRTHQLRAHAEAIGHPIIGDPKYGLQLKETDPRRTDPLRAVPAEVERKLHLLARRLVLPHPKGGTLDVTAPLPPHMQKTFDLFGFDVKQYDPIVDAPQE
jgi:23S rRNA pseudouridine955/2504/2580 synthase